MLIGFNALAKRHKIHLAQPLRVKSIIGSTRTIREANDHLDNQYPTNYQPEDSFIGHFEFGLKYEEIHLEFFARLFAAIGPEPIEAWCQKAPYGQYARRTGFLYEWLTGQRLNVPDVDNGAYCTVLPAQSYLVRSTPERVKRWRVNNNLPGTVDFCPIVRRTPAVQNAIEFDLKTALKALDQQFVADILMRTASWLTFKESRASFLIEKESEQTDRVQRFAHVIAQHCGHIENPLSSDSLRTLQAGILGDDALGLGLRLSPVFVGQATLREDLVHYIAPPFAEVPHMLNGLSSFETITRGAEPLARAAVIAFGFVYIHPMRDGNGRLHRFLINDSLIRDQAIPPDVILPISATITSSIDFRAGYNKTLDSFSKPFMQRHAAAYRFGPIETFADGTRSNFIFDAYEDALFAWRYPDLTAHVLYTGTVVAHTVLTEMAEEARVLVRFQCAQQQLKEVLEMPDQDANRIIRSLKDNNWQLSGKLKKEYPQLTVAVTAERVIEAVRSGFEAGLDNQ
jgi:hypothetical protein